MFHSAYLKGMCMPTVDSKNDLAFPHCLSELFCAPLFGSRGSHKALRCFVPGTERAEWETRQKTTLQMDLRVPVPFRNNKSFLN